METQNCKELIVSLITDDLIHTKLTEGLASLGLNAGNYMLNLSDTIINLMGFEGAQNERVYAHYLDLLKQGRFVDHTEHTATFKKLAHDIYYNLQLQKSLPAGFGKEKK